MINFVLGFVFALVFYPILDGFTSLILSWFELLKGRIAVDIAKSNQKVEEIRQPQSATHSIGFAVPDPIEDWEEDDDDE